MLNHTSLLISSFRSQGRHEHVYENAALNASFVSDKSQDDGVMTSGKRVTASETAIIFVQDILGRVLLLNVNSEHINFVSPNAPC